MSRNQPAAESIVRKLTPSQRRALVEHVNGPILVDRSEWPTTSAMLSLGLLRADVEGACPPRPSATVLTDLGRAAAAAILAEWAEGLIRAGCLDEVDERAKEQLRPLEILRRLKADRVAASDQGELPLRFPRQVLRRRHPRP